MSKSTRPIAPAPAANDAALTNRPTTNRSLSTYPYRPDSAIPDLDRTADVIGAHMVADAIETYLRAKHRSQVINERIGGDGPDQYVVAAQKGAALAADALAYAIVAYHVAEPPSRGLREDDPSFGVAYRGKLYMAVPDEEKFAGLAVVDFKPGRDCPPDLASLTDLGDYFGEVVYSAVEIDCLKLAAVGAQSQPQPAHVAALEILGRNFRLSFWTEQEARSLPAGVLADNYFKRLSGFGWIGLELVHDVDQDEWTNTVFEATGQGIPYPDARKLRDLQLRVSPDDVAALLDAVEKYGVKRSTELIAAHRADAEMDRDYWRRAVSAAADRRVQEREDEPVGFRITEEEIEQHFIARRGLTADGVVAEAFEDVSNVRFDGFRDQAIWQGNQLIATITHGPAGEPVVTRFDQPADPSPAPSAFDMGELAGVELPSPEVVLLNAPPKQKKGEPKPRGKRSPRTARG